LKEREEKMVIVRPIKGFYLLTVILIAVLLPLSLFFALQKPVSINVDGKTIHSRVFFASKVGEVLEKESIKIGARDMVEPSLNAVVKKNCNIVVTRAFKVTVVADGKSNNVISTPISIREAIKLAGVTLGEKDIVKNLASRQNCSGPGDRGNSCYRKPGNRKKQRFPAVQTGLQTIPWKGAYPPLSAGKDGLAMQTIRVIYHNGQEVKREVIKSETLVEPKNRLVAMGTITSVSRGSHTINFKEAKYMETSAYTYTGYRTATGRTPEVGTVAVDPSVIPLGSSCIRRIWLCSGSGYWRSHQRHRVDVFMEDALIAQLGEANSKGVYHELTADVFTYV
jgi:hypothetical protein